jgi:hypothetical protein
VRGKRTGTGLYRVGNGDVYEGAFVDDQYHGPGCMRYADGARYEGAWSHSRWDGRGKLHYANRDAYDGDFRLNQRHGQGHFRYDGGGAYTGGWRYDEPHGVGRRTFASGAEYEGEWSDGRMEGRGIYRSAEGHMYVGTFLDSRFHGEGTLVYVNGDRYQGGFAQGVFFGSGRFDRSDGSFYEGEYRAELRCGVTVRRERERRREGSAFAAAAEVLRQRHASAAAAAAAAADGAVGVDTAASGAGGVVAGEGAESGGDPTTALEAIVAAEKRKAQGYIERFNAEGVEGKPGHVLVGSAEDDAWLAAGDRQYARTAPALDGRRHGVGTQGYANGAVYTGRWKLDAQTGYGVYRGPDGDSYEGEWREGRRCGKGKATFCNGGRAYVCPMGYTHDGMGACVYDGEWTDNRMEGYGVLTCGDGREYRGTWRGGQRHGYGVLVLIPPGVRGVGNSVLDEDGRRWSATYTAVREYRGDFRESDRHGEGAVTLVNGDVYEGTFIRNRLEGLVRLSFSNPAFGPARARTAHAWYEHGTRQRWLREGVELHRLRAETAGGRFVSEDEKARLEAAVVERLQAAAGHLQLLSIQDVRANRRKAAEDALAAAAARAKKAAPYGGALRVGRVAPPLPDAVADGEVREAVRANDAAIAEVEAHSTLTAEMRAALRRQELLGLGPPKERTAYTMKGIAESMGLSAKILRDPLTRARVYAKAP